MRFLGTEPQYLQQRPSELDLQILLSNKLLPKLVELRENTLTPIILLGAPRNLSSRRPSTAYKPVEKREGVGKVKKKF